MFRILENPCRLVLNEDGCDHPGDIPKVPNHSQVLYVKILGPVAFLYQNGFQWLTLSILE